jgi:hypothetical protein
MKSQLITGYEGPEGEWRCSSTVSLTTALDGVGGQLHAPASLPPGKKHGARFVGGWVGTRAGPEGCEKSRSHQGSNP